MVNELNHGVWSCTATKSVGNVRLKLDRKWDGVSYYARALEVRVLRLTYALLERPQRNWCLTGGVNRVYLSLSQETCVHLSFLRLFSG